MNCPNCGAPLRDSAAFCTNCGTPVQAKKASKLKSTMPMGEPAAPQPQPQPEARPTYQPPAAPTYTTAPGAAPSGGAPARPAAPGGSVYDAFEKTMPTPPAAPAYRSAPAYAPAAPAVTKRKKRADGPSQLVKVLHHVRAYLAILLAVGCIVLLFQPWFLAGLEVSGSTSYDEKDYEFAYGSVDEDDLSEISILDIVKFSEVDDLISLDLSEDYEDFADILKDHDIKESNYIDQIIAGEKDGKTVDISKIQIGGLKVPTGVLAMAPQLLCILLMVIFFIIGVIRVFACEPFADGAPKTGWLKAGGIVGIILSVITGAEVFALNKFFDKVVDKIGKEAADVMFDLSLSLTKWYIIFAAASVVIVLLATHWGKRKLYDRPELD